MIGEGQFHHVVVVVDATPKSGPSTRAAVPHVSGGLRRRPPD
jgi:hypothetical protein